MCFPLFHAETVRAETDRMSVDSTLTSTPASVRQKEPTMLKKIYMQVVVTVQAAAHPRKRHFKTTLGLALQCSVMP
jgi:hypothetical protein